MVMGRLREGRRQTGKTAICSHDQVTSSDRALATSSHEPLCASVAVAVAHALAAWTMASPLLRLPTETLDRILRHLGPGDLCRVARACRRLLAPARRVLFARPVLWGLHGKGEAFRAACVDDPGSTVYLIEWLSCDWWTGWKDWLGSLPSLPSLRAVDISDTTAFIPGDPSVTVDRDRVKPGNLTVHTINFVDILECFGWHPHLRELAVWNPTGVSFDAETRRRCDPLLRLTWLAIHFTLSTGTHGLPMFDGLPMLCPNVERLDLHLHGIYCPGLPDVMIELIARFRCLRELKVVGSLSYTRVAGFEDAQPPAVDDLAPVKPDDFPLPSLAPVVRRLRKLALASGDIRNNRLDPVDLFTGPHPFLESIYFTTFDLTEPGIDLFLSITAGNFPALRSVEVNPAGRGTRRWFGVSGQPVRLGPAFDCAAYLDANDFKVHFCELFFSAVHASVVDPLAGPRFHLPFDEPPVFYPASLRFCERGWRGTQEFCDCA